VPAASINLDRAPAMRLENLRIDWNDVVRLAQMISVGAAMRGCAWQDRDRRSARRTCRCRPAPMNCDSVSTRAPHSSAFEKRFAPRRRIGEKYAGRAAVLRIIQFCTDDRRATADRIDQHQPADCFRIGCGDLGRQQSAEGMADECRRCKIQPFEQLAVIDDKIVPAMSACTAFASPRLVPGNWVQKGMAFREAGCEGAIGREAPWTVQIDERRPLSGNLDFAVTLSCQS